MVITKKCIACKNDKPTVDFCKNKSKPDGFNPYCRPCANKISTIWKNNNLTHYKLQRKEFRKKNKIKDRDYMLSWRYGISLNEFNKMLVKQNNVCKICLGPPTEKEKFVVDHDHHTGKVRGILCGYCNRCLGMARDDETILKKMIQYLKKSKKEGNY